MTGTFGSLEFKLLSFVLSWDNILFAGPSVKLFYLKSSLKLSFSWSRSGSRARKLFTELSRKSQVSKAPIHFHAADKTSSFIVELVSAAKTFAKSGSQSFATGCHKLSHQRMHDEVDHRTRRGRNVFAEPIPDVFHGG